MQSNHNNTCKLQLCSIDPETLQLTGEDADKRRVIAWENVCSAAKTENVMLSSCAVCGWLGANTDKSLSDLDRLLEEHRVHMRIIAVEASAEQREQIGQGVLRIVNVRDTSQNCTYTMVVSCRPPAHAEAEMQKHWRTVDENRGALEHDTGVIMQVNDVNDVPTQRALYTPDEAKRAQLRALCASQAAGDDVSTHMNLVMYGLCRVQVSPVGTAQIMEVLQAHIRAYKESTGCEPTQVVYGEARDKSTIVAFQDAQDASTYISDIALMIGHNAAGEKLVAAVPLNDRAAWTGFADAAPAAAAGAAAAGASAATAAAPDATAAAQRA